MYAYDPAAVSAHELPVYRRCMNVDYQRFQAKQDMQSFCVACCGIPADELERYHFTPEEDAAIAAVANGGTWPVPDRVYTRADWENDGEFSAAPGQKVALEVYDAMLDCMPPFRLPRCRRTQGIFAGFLMGEPHCFDPKTGKQLYLAFGSNRRDYYFIGLLPVRPEE